MKKLLFTIIVFIMLPAANALDDNYYFSINPDSESCFNVNLPDDIGLYRPDNYTISIETSAKTNLKYLSSYTGGENKVSVPLCFSAAGLKENEFFVFGLNLSSGKKTFDFHGGACVTKTADADVAKAGGLNPCEILNGYNELFTAEFEQPIKYAASGGNVTFTVYLTAVTKMVVELKISSETGHEEKAFVDVGPSETKSVDFVFPVNASGDYRISLQARAAVNKKFCEYMFCRKEVVGRLLVDRDFAPSGWSAFVSPRFSNSYAGSPVEYVLKISNYQGAGEFSVDIKLPEPIKADATKIKETLNTGEEKTVKISVRPPAEPKTYRIEFIFSDGRSTILKTAVLSVGEAVSDGIRAGRLGQESVHDINQLLISPDGKTDVEKIGSLYQNKTRKTVEPKQKPPGDQVFYLAGAMAAIIFLLAAFAYKKAKVIPG